MNIVITEAQHGLIRNYAFDNKISMNEVIRRAVYEYVKFLEGDEKQSREVKDFIGSEDSELPEGVV